MAKLPELPKMNIAGPFWTAEAEVIRLADPTTNFAFRALFVDTNPRPAVAEKDVLLPGTLLALVFVTSVTVRPTNGNAPQYVWKRSGGKPDGKLSPQAIRDAITANTAALLLLQAPPDGWPAGADGKLPTFTCLNGEIGLDMMTAQAQATEKLYGALGLTAQALGTRSGPAHLLSALSVHASGLSAYGQIRLLWDSTPVNAVFQLAQIVPDPEPTPGTAVRGFRLSIETERLTEAEHAVLVASWQRFNQYANPNNPLNHLIEPVSAPEWATLELANPLAIPRLFWEIAPWQEQPDIRPMHFAGDEFSLLLTDRQPYDPASAPDTLARLTPERATLAVDGSGLRLELAAGNAPAQSTGQIVYVAGRDGETWNEHVTLDAMTLAFNPNEAARTARSALQLTEPEWVIAPPPAITQPLNPALLWSFMPLEDGWAQLPLPNLSEQVYLDAGVVIVPPEPPENVVRGAVSYGNDDPAVLDTVPGEQPWSITLAAARHMTATWTLEPNGDGYRLESAQVTLHRVEIALTGVVWLSTNAPSAADALPDFDDWIDGLETLALRTVTGRELFPPLVRLAFESFTFTRRTLPALSANLGAWAFQYQVDSALLKTLITTHALPPDTLGSVLPLVWRRHPTLPMIQALALTQSVTPPNVPIPSRQLAPFELPVVQQNGVAVPDNWRFAAEGASRWPRYGGALALAREWLGDDADRLFDLPLVALSLPGLVLDPRPDGAAPGSDAALGLPIQYRYDLPYTDEIQALAQLPKIPKDPRESTPLPDTPRPEPPHPLTRSDYATHWRRLAERANLASADSVAAFSTHDGQTVLNHLIAPYVWPVRAEIALDTYPGALTLDNVAPAASAPLSLQGEAALRGVDGHFANGTGDLRRLSTDVMPDDSHYTVTAGSMSAHRQSDGGYRDQRGLVRAASLTATNLLRTAVQHPETGDVLLTTARAPLTLTHGTAGVWQFWFRDLPVQGAVFTKESARSKKVQELALDINDPEARSSDLEHRAGYEWRLRPGEENRDNPPPTLDLFGLHFFPLVLDRVELEDDGVSAVEVIGRLQLPVAGGAEQADLSNAVRLRFSGTETNLVLQSIALDGFPIEWPLALSSGEATDAPRLVCQAISLTDDQTALSIDTVQLHFFLFRVEWTIELPPIRFPNPALPPFTLPGADSPEPIVPQQITLGLDPTGGKHTLDLTLKVQLGTRMVAGLQALYTFREGQGTIVHDTSGVGTPLDLTIGAADAIEWTSTGLAVKAPTTILSSSGAADIVNACRQTNQLTIETWITPASRTVIKEGRPGRIVTIAKTVSDRNVSLQQGQATQTDSSSFYHVRIRNKPNDLEGMPPVKTPSDTLKTQIQHVVYTFDTHGTGRIYVDGEEQAQTQVGGSFAEWQNDYKLTLANEVTEDRPWLGTYRLVAIYNRALAAEEIVARYRTGPTATPTNNRQTFSATLTYNLIEMRDDRFALDAAQLFDDLVLDAALPDGSPSVLANDTTLQFAWHSYHAVSAEKLHILPGMQLADQQTPGLNERAAPGFATLTFRAIGKPNAMPDLPLTGAFLEALLVAHWGRSLQDGASRRAEAAVVFGSSAGDVVLGYTGRLQGSAWEESFLLNGMLTVTNLVSWPQPLNYDAAKARITLPAARTAAMPPLMHLRHTIRVLLNQHVIPAQTLVTADGPLLFSFAFGQSWQPLALVEHQLIEVTPDADLEGTQFGRETRWTVVQEVRLLTPRSAARFLQSLAARKTVDPVEGVSPLGTASAGYLGAGLSALLTDPHAALDMVPEDTLLVEASTHHLIKLDPIRDAPATTLQYLPTGSQGALFSSPQDYSPTDPTDPRWLLLTTPFLGRLQDSARDFVEAGANAPNPLQVDPLFLIGRQRAATPTEALPRLALALSGWADDAPLTITFASLDTAVGHSFARLDPLALEESWFRAHNPQSEPQEEVLQSILAALPDTPARLSRSVALRQAFDPRRAFYPPKSSDLASLDEPSPVAAPLWRESNLLLTQAVSTLAPTDPGYGWGLTAVLIASSDLMGTSAAGQQCYPAATLIPASLKLGDAANPRPLSLVISPYLRLEWRPAPPVPQEGESPLKIRLLLAELLCLAPGTTRLQPVASRMWSVQPDDETQDAEDNLRALAQDWARRLQPLLAPESPITVLRYRIIRDNARPDTRDEAALTTAYSFALTTVQSAGRLARRVFRIRAELAAVRYREGQCNQSPVPANTHDFELAPPQTTGVQPLYLIERPASTGGAAWHWGLSALRVSLRYTVDQAGVVGKATPSDEGQTLWWQTAQRTVQFRSALHSDRPTGGLPQRFRAPAIRSLLPVLPDPPMPALTPDMFEQPLLPEPKAGQAGVEDGLALARWQPVLPGGLRYLIVGARAGVFVTLRNHVLRQSGVTFTGETPRPRGFGVMSGGLPVQHRAPRPVPLPQNLDGQQDIALRTWASHYDPLNLCLITPTPADEAFRAGFADPLENLIYQQTAQRLQLQLAAPERFALDATWDGVLTFVYRIDGSITIIANGTATTTNTSITDWTVACEIVDAQHVTTLVDITPATLVLTPVLRRQLAAIGADLPEPNISIVPADQLAVRQFALSGNTQTRALLARNFIGTLTPGASLTARMQILFTPQQPGAAPYHDGYQQALEFPLFVANPAAARLPLVPRYIHFEDPEYNRRLASPSAHASVLVQFPKTTTEAQQRTITLAAERRECNPTSTLAIRFDWDAAPPVVPQVALLLQKIDLDQTPRDLAPAAGGMIVVTEGKISLISLAALQQSNGVFVPGERLRIKLEISNGPVKPAVVQLDIMIIEAPIIPATESAYALLRRQVVSGQTHVECVRFAWAPAAQRVELVNPADLKTEVVRRRAVFHWRDSARPGTQPVYALQKITPTGATHIPDM